MVFIYMIEKLEDLEEGEEVLMKDYQHSSIFRAQMTVD